MSWARAAFCCLPVIFTFVPVVVRSEENSGMARLPKEIFDVIPPSERVLGERGTMRVWQATCRVGPTSWARRRIVDIAVQEWAFFGFQTVDASEAETRTLPQGLVPDALNPERGLPRIVRHYPRLGSLEDEPRMDTTIGGYWSATPEGPRALGIQNRAWTGPGAGAVYWVEPWSAAFVSWVMCEAGLGDMAQFRRSAAHRVYIDQAIRARDGLEPDAAYEAYDAGEKPIEPGDLLCNARDMTDYRSLADRRNAMGGPAETHCDIVVKIDAGAKRVLVIGGNVDQSVSLTILPLIADKAFLRPVDAAAIDGARTIFAHLKLRSPAIDPFALDSSPTVKALSASPQ